MEEVFQSFEHYKDWLLQNWHKDKILDKIILANKLIIEKEKPSDGESFRMMTKEEFIQMESKNFIKIPVLEAKTIQELEALKVKTTIEQIGRQSPEYLKNLSLDIKVNK